MMFCMKKLAAIGLLAGVAILPAACASRQGAPQDAGTMTSPSLSNPISPSLPPPGTPAASGSSSGMDMQAMMTHCADMRRQARPGTAVAPDIRQMMAQCDQMDRMHGGAVRPVPTTR